jgi:hypothetical protein
MMEECLEVFMGFELYYNRKRGMVKGKGYEVRGNIG